MERRIIINPYQQITESDINLVGEFARSSLDHVVNDGIEAGRKFWGFPVTITGPLEITVGVGRYYTQGKVYFRNEDGGIVINLADYIPVVTKKIVTVVAWGNQMDTAVEPRTFLIDSETGQTEAEAVATESRRFAEINAVPGTENANPQPPALDMNVLAIAHVTLTPAGVESVRMVEDNRLSSTSGNKQKIDELRAWRDRAGTRLDTLDTDMAGLASRVRGTAKTEQLFEVAADMARVKERLDLSDDLTSYGADHFLDLSETDAEHPDYLAKTEEGARFAHAQERIANVNLLNPLEERLTLKGSFALPNYTPVARISITGRDGEIPVSQYTVGSTELKQLSRTRTRLRYGPVQTVCTNAQWWKTGRYDPITGTFKRDGETWLVSIDPMQAAANLNDPDHRIMRVQQVWEDQYEEAYWDANVQTETVSGSIIAETWLNAQDGWITNVDLFFTQVAAAGDVHVLVVETTNGAPDLRRVVAKITVPQSDLKTYPAPTNIPIGPIYVTKGRRYATVLVTQGAHTVSYVQGNKYAQGTLFYSGDGGAWFMGDATRDLSMVLYYAEFTATRAEVQVQPFELANGIANVDILAESYIPEGCELIWQVQVNGAWRSLKASDINALNGLNALLPARVVFVGTTDLMPCLTFGAASTVTTWRCRTDFKHVSSRRTMPAPIDYVEVRLRLEGWDGNRHDCDCDLFTGVGLATVTAATRFEDRATEDPSAIERRFFFELVAPISEYKIKITGTTNSALVTFHVAERIDLASDVT